MAKLQLKPGQRLAVLHRPTGTDLGVAPSGDDFDPDDADAVLLFVTSVDELQGGDCNVVLEAARRDDLAWVAYPKAGRLGTDLSREALAAALRERGLRPVRQVSIDGVWSAMRFRPQA